MKNGRYEFVAFAVIFASGCSGAYNAQQETTVRKRASFDMSCPEPQLQMMKLDEGYNGMVQSFGVSGCGKKATYVRAPDSNTWVLNGTQQESTVAAGSGN
jgi:hypothetical protein